MVDCGWTSMKLWKRQVLLLGQRVSNRLVSWDDVHRVRQKSFTIPLLITLLNGDRLSNIFYRHADLAINLYTLLIIYPTSPQRRRCTSLWNINGRNHAATPWNIMVINDKSWGIVDSHLMYGAIFDCLYDINIRFFMHSTLCLFKNKALDFWL